MVRPARVAVVGAGPAGFYAAGQLLAAGGVEVDMLERLPTPWGLVRGGVAPDHPKIKSVSRVFEKTAAQPGFRFFGNVEVGRDVASAELSAWYDAVLYAIGAAGDRRLGIPGEDLPGTWSAAQFVGWYNGHPDHRDLPVDLRARRAVVIGNGNVAIDVARMLTLSHAELAATDVADHALEAIAASGIEEIVVLGRRGPREAAFTTAELLELGELDGADVQVDARDLPDNDDGDDQTVRRNLEILRGYAARPPCDRPRRITLRFLASPVEILGRERVEGVRVARNELVRGADGTPRAVPGEARETIAAQLVFRAVGYAGVELAGLPFDARAGRIPHREGRVEGHPRTYVAGWIKRGPSGVIGTNKKCAVDTVTGLLEDLRAPAPDGRRPLRAAEVGAQLLRRQPQLVPYAGWQAIDAAERAAGAGTRPRVKLTRVPELLAAAGRAPLDQRQEA